MIHMENKDLHVAIVFSPICGPNGKDIADNSSSLDLVRLLELNEKFLIEDLTEAVSKLLASKLTEEGIQINRLDEIIGMLYS